jgi:4-hydroxy-2-oxoheptanedioate aldolase
MTNHAGEGSDQRKNLARLRLANFARLRLANFARLRTNRAKKILEGGEAVLGAMVNIPEPALVELCGLAGLDFVFIDGEHGAIGIRDVADMARAADTVEVATIVRVSRNAPDVIAKVLDAGASGIIVPDVRTREDAENAVRAAKHAPFGMRGVGSGRARGYSQLMAVEQYAAMANAESLVVALLEHVDVVGHVDAILDLPGIDVFIIGANDLSQSMGLLGRTDHPRFQEVKTEITDRVLRAGRVMGTRIRSVEEADSYLDRGFRWLHIDLQEMLLATASQLAEGVRSLMQKRRKEGGNG